MHKRNAGSTDSNDSLGSMVGSLKSQLNNLLDSIAMPPDQPELVGSGGLKPTGGGGSSTLSVLEEEGSDVGSTAAISPRSPLSPATTAAKADSAVLGFSVDERGLARTAPSTSAGSGWSMLTKRFNQARENASDLLREAERRLGNAMTLPDDLLSESQSQPKPRIQLEEASFDSDLTKTQSPWYEAAGGQGRNRSPRLGATVTESRKSGESNRSSLSLPRAASPQPSSPPLGAVPGGNLFGLLKEGRNSGEAKRRSSGDWAWGHTDADSEWSPSTKRESLVDIDINTHDSSK